MWFHLLSVATFIALGSCQDFYGNSTVPDCNGPDCPCSCPKNSCPFCPVPQQSNLLGSCGTIYCPCSKTIPNLKPNVLKPNETMARGISTVHVYPTGPICSGFNVKPNMVLTVSTCVKGMTAEQLFVTLNTPEVAVLKVTKILHLLYEGKDPVPVILITTKPEQPVIYYTLPPRIDESLPSEIHRFEVSNSGRNYGPTRKPVISHYHCFCNTDINFVCADSPVPVRMGWNDIGTPLVEVHGSKFVAQGIYIGTNLYQESYRVSYYSLLPHYHWLTTTIEKNK